MGLPKHALVVYCPAALLSLLLFSSLTFLSHFSATRAATLVPYHLPSRPSSASTDYAAGVHVHPAASQSQRVPRAVTSPDMEVIYDRRVSSIISHIDVRAVRNISSWLNSLDANGKWPDSQVDYTTGCEARRANWPAQEHWQRIFVMAGAWHGGLANASEWLGNGQLRNATGRAMAYWFNRDFGNQIACLDSGGTASCPCDNPKNQLWNTNWYSNIILIPSLVGQSCILLNSSLSQFEASQCGLITARSYGTFSRQLNGVTLTGANTLDVGKISVDAALLTNSPDVLSDAYRRVHDELTIRNEVKADGIRADGSFGQHSGVLYNGNYGKDYTNVALDLEIASAETQYAANVTSRSALETLFEGHKWMIYSNTLTQVKHFDFSVIGRMITFPVVDKQASSAIQMDLSSISELGNLWSSTPITNFANQLLPDTANANAGGLVGNKMFYANDYMVQRGDSYVTTLKMYSKRTVNTECINSQNGKGFHLSDGTLYTYLLGDEYEDISAAWDWDLTPGITTDYQRTSLTCDKTSFTGVETFVGGVSNGRSGVAAMRYKNPLTGALQWQKTWFLLGSGVHRVMVNVVSPSNSSTAPPIYSVLDQKRTLGPTLVNGQVLPNSSSAESTFALPQSTSLWHARVGYTFPSDIPATLNVRKGPRRGDWSTIGTSTQPPFTADLWAAWLQHRPSALNTPLEYNAYPGLSGYDDFVAKQKAIEPTIQTLENSFNASAIFDRGEGNIMGVFWSAGSISEIDTSPGLAPLTITSNAAIAWIVSVDTGVIIVSDPAQGRNTASVKIAYGSQGKLPTWWTGSGRSKTVSVTFPRGGLGGSSVTLRI